MRIVIEMHGVQAKSRWSNHLLALTLKIAKNSNEHEVWLALNMVDLESVLSIRRTFEGVIPNERIQAYETLAPAEKNHQHSKEHLYIPGLIREHFIKQLNPDVILYTWIFEESTYTPLAKSKKLLSDKTYPVLSIGPNPRMEIEDSTVNVSKSCSFEKNFWHIKNATHMLVFSEEDRQKFSVNIGIENIISLDIAESIYPGENSEYVTTIDHTKCWKEPAIRVIAELAGLYKELQVRECHFLRQAKQAKPLLAYVSPLPPERSGISDYSAELLPYLANHYDIEVIVAQDHVSDPWVNENCPIRSVHWFRKYAKTYDRVLYHFGNSPFHRHMFDLIEETPGIIVLHDFYLAHIIAKIDEGANQTDSFLKNLYRSHGYPAVQQLISSKDIQTVLWDYPVNFDLLQKALEVIVHSHNSCRLAKKYYGVVKPIDWPVIPLMREEAQAISKLNARKKLSISKDKFVVCSFGMLGPSKLNHSLLEAWLASSLARDEKNILVFVGQIFLDDYGKELLKKIQGCGLANRIVITDWVDLQTYRHYLAAADIAVQLRSLSRGETSAAVLDCMNYGLATIANSNGSMADLPNEAVHLLDDEFEVCQLKTALEEIWQDSNYRESLSTNARELIQTSHSPLVCTNQYVNAIETTYLKNRMKLQWPVSSLTESETPKSEEYISKMLAQAIANSSVPRITQAQLLIDVSAIALSDLGTGIQRVVRAQLAELLTSPSAELRVEPVYLTKEGGSWHYRYARNWTLTHLGYMHEHVLDDAPVDFDNGDILFCADLYGGPVVEAHQDANLYRNLIARGVSVNFQVFDILPASNPEWFPPGASDCHINWMKVVAEASSGAICISDNVATEFKSWLNQNESSELDPSNVKFFHLGADITNTSPTVGMPDNALKTLEQLESSNSFLMVGTIEPRKGHLQTLEAFELLWEQPDADFKLVIVGNEGWSHVPDSDRRTIPEIVSRLRSHPELGNRLFWLERTSDEYLEKIYSVCTCLIAASEGEGFGLPLIEASQHKLPIIARDIGVFREVAGDHAFYFKGKSAAPLAKAVKKWLRLYKSKQHPVSDYLPLLTWKDSTEQLLSVLIQNVLISSKSSDKPAANAK